jgi:hypothetical protein
MWDLEFLFFRNLVNLGHFPHEKSFAYIKIIFFSLKFAENFPLKETLMGTTSGCHDVINNYV